MEKDLQQFCAVPQVAGAFVCDNRGDVVASTEPAVLATVAMATLGREAARAFSALEAAGYRANRLDYRYDCWRLMARDMGEGLLLVICQPAVDAALVRMTADVCVASWKKDSKAQKRLAKGVGRRGDLLAAGQIDDASWQSYRQLVLQP